MAIDKRQISDIDMDIKLPNIVCDNIIYGAEADLSVYTDGDTGDYHFVMTLPNSLAPTAQTKPESEPTVDTGDIAPPLEEPIQPLHKYTVQQIVDQVRAGRAAQYWPVGSRIPIFINSYQISSRTLRDQKLYGNWPRVAVVIGHDHNLANETPQVKHSMTFALMHRYNSEDWWEKNEQAIITASPSEFTRYVMIGTQHNLLAALPNDWNSCVISTTKAGSVETTDENQQGKATSKMFMLSYYEVYGYDNNTQYMTQSTWDNGAQVQYEYFAKNGFPKSVHCSTYNHKYLKTNMVVASRSLYKNKALTSILLTDRLSTNPANAFYIKSKSELSSATEKSFINYTRTQFMNILHSSRATVGYADKLPAIANGNPEHYSVDVYTGIAGPEWFNVPYIRVLVPLNESLLGVGTGTGTAVQGHSVSKGAYCDVSDSYYYSSTNGIPCFNIG